MANLATNIGNRWLASTFVLVTMLCAAALLTDVASLGADTFNAGDGSGSFSLSYQFDADKISDVWHASIVNKVLAVTLPVLCVLMPTFAPIVAIPIIVMGAAIVLLVQHVGFVSSLSDSSIVLLFLSVLVAYLLSYFFALALTRRKVDLFFRQYVPSQLSSHYMRNPSEIGMGGELRDITIMFCDIKRFTAISETLDPDVLPQWLNRFFDVVSDIIVKHNGTIDKYIGDSVMAIWGAPGQDVNHASNGLQAAIEILSAVKELSEQFKAAGCPEIEVGIGVSTGKAHVGHLGSPHRISYTAVGDAVNMADRLEQCTGYYDLPLIVNDGTMEAVGDFLFRELDTVHVRGRQRFIRIYQPICHQAQASPNIHRQLQQHRKAMQFYRRGMWKDAELLFRNLSAESGESDFYGMYIKRLVDIRQSQQETGGTHVVDFTQKIG